MRRMLMFHQRAILVSSVLIGCALCVQAQSGRRSTSKPIITAPSVSEPKEVEAKPKTPARLQILLVAENPSPFNQTPYYLSDTVLDECARRLQEASNVLANVGRDDMTRAQAAQAAKNEKERYVVWLQLGNDVADSSRQVQDQYAQLYVSYVVYDPGTGKVRASGRTYNGLAKVGNIGVSGPPSSRRTAVYEQEMVKRSAREAADRVLKTLGISINDNQRVPL